MADMSKFSPDSGSTILNVKDRNAVHWGDQSKGYVGKNKLPNHATNQSGNGTLTVTVNADKSITVNGTPSSTANIELLSTGETIVLDSASKLSGCPSGGSETTYLLQVYDGTNWTNDYGNGNNLVASTIQRALVQVKANVTVNNLTFKPMITDANIPNSDYAHYEPWYMSNRELTDIAQHNNNPTVIATANANQKWSEQLSALYTEYQKYSMNQRRKMFISYDDITGWNFINSAPTFGTFAFNNVVGSINSMEIFTLRLSNQKAYDAYFKTDGTVTVTDMSEQTNANALKLCIV